MMTLAARFWTKVDTSGLGDAMHCWTWTAAKLPKGYGRFGLDGRVVLAHRMSYELACGPIPDGMHVDHTCYNPSCVRPSHLRVVTPKQNIENRAGLSRNNSTGVRGVSRRGNKFRASVKHAGRIILDREFDTLEAASSAARQARLDAFTHNDADRCAS